MVEDDERSGPSLEPQNVLRIEDERFEPDRAALVTGAASGIGRATALALAKNGPTTVAVDIDGDGLEATAARADDWSIPGRVEPVVGDLRDDEDLDAVVDEASDVGELMILANIAGLQHIDPSTRSPTSSSTGCTT